MKNSTSLNRRHFLESTAVAAVAASSTAVAHPTAGTSPETLVQELYASLKTKQRDQICFDWNHKDPKRGLLRTFVANNWNITKAEINSDFYSDSQRAIIEKIFEGIIAPEWHERYYQQLEDDAGGFGNEQSVAIFGKPGDGKFELVLTGRHMTLRCDGNSAEHVAFGGPIFTAMPRPSMKTPNTPTMYFGVRRSKPTSSIRCLTVHNAKRPWSRKPHESRQ